MEFSSTLTDSQTSEIEDARRRLRLPLDEILLAALGRTIAETVGDGTIAVDLGGPGRSVLKPDVDLHRTVGWFTTVYPVALTCAKDAARPGTLGRCGRHPEAVPHYGIGYGLLRYMYAPTARLLGATRPADIFFSYVGTIPDLPAVSLTMLPFSSTPTRRCRCARRSRASVTLSNSGCIARVMSCTWIGGMTPAGSGRPTSNRSRGGFPAALMELVRDAMRGG